VQEGSLTGLRVNPGVPQLLIGRRYHSGGRGSPNGQVSLEQLKPASKSKLDGSESWALGFEEAQAFKGYPAFSASIGDASGNGGEASQLQECNVRFEEGR